LLVAPAEIAVLATHLPSNLLVSWVTARTYLRPALAAVVHPSS
jgi:hypothetical protein